MPFFVHIFAAIEQMLHLIVFACCHSKLRSAANQDKASAQSMQMSNVKKQSYSKDKKRVMVQVLIFSGSESVYCLKSMQPQTNISQIIKIQSFKPYAERHFISFHWFFIKLFGVSSHGGIKPFSTITPISEIFGYNIAKYVGLLNVFNWIKLLKLNKN